MLKIQLKIQLKMKDVDFVQSIMVDAFVGKKVNKST